MQQQVEDLIAEASQLKQKRIRIRDVILTTRQKQQHASVGDLEDLDGIDEAYQHLDQTRKRLQDALLLQLLTASLKQQAFQVHLKANGSIHIELPHLCTVEAVSDVSRQAKMLLPSSPLSPSSSVRLQILRVRLGMLEALGFATSPAAAAATASLAADSNALALAVLRQHTRTSVEAANCIQKAARSLEVLLPSEHVAAVAAAAAVEGGGDRSSDGNAESLEADDGWNGGCTSWRMLPSLIAVLLPPLEHLRSR
ncbi:hypothetical protein cyc_07644 [Cyclospora cayetanensis]|uniref:Uncharacterized protein n=1 Tax=Cyclospora cayetanensis TaxID=88456 RepID=A0A1D3D2S6_9EIME|nr:hypothetical protein cyc_07644 [Cyclospora cayetanensis]